MPRISKIQKDLTLTKDDKLLGSDVSGATRNYTLEDISNFVGENAGVHKHHQNSANSVWTITHNFNLENYLPSVTVKMSTGATYANLQGMGMVTYVNKNELKINWLSEESGYAYLKK